MLPLLRLDHASAAKLGRRLRKLTQRLGGVREYDVLLALTEELAGTGRYNAPAVRRVAASLAEDESTARARLLDKIDVDDIHRLAGKLDKAAKTLECRNTRAGRTGNSPRSSRWAIDARLSRRASTLIAGIANAGTIYFAERLHPVRIAVKKLRYAAELAADTAGLRSSPDVRQLRRVQDILGRLHDVEVLVARVRGLQASLSPPDVTAWRDLDALVAALEDDCRRLHGRYLAERDALLGLCARLSGRGSEARAQKSQAGRRL
jgi:CHAD domain-containing protein